MMRIAWRMVGWNSVVWIVLNFAFFGFAAAEPLSDEESSIQEASTPSDSQPAATHDPASVTTVEEGDPSTDAAPSDEQQMPAAEAITPEPESSTDALDPSVEAKDNRIIDDAASDPVLDSPDAELISPAVPMVADDPDTEGTAPTQDNATPSRFKTFFGHVESDFTFTAGLRRDGFQWSIAGDTSGNNPNILSELTWTNVDSYQLTITNRSLYKRYFYFRGDLNYAWIQRGNVQDSDYNEDDRNDEFSRSLSESNGDQLWDVSLAGGYPFFFKQDRLMVVPLFGLSYHKQNFRITDGEQVITSGSLPPIGPLEGLDSTYRSTWFGPWIGVDLRYFIKGDTTKGDPPMELGLSFELHYANFFAEANWNLRDDLEHPVSFEHEDTGIGIALAGEWLISLSSRWDLVFRTTFQYWKTDDGEDRIFNADGTESRTQLNEVEWRSNSFMLGANFQF